MRKTLSFGIVFMLVCSVFIPISLGYNIKTVRQQPVSYNLGNTLYVGGSGGGNYTKIQDAINDAVSGDTVFVYDDSSPYKELLVIDKSISLIGEDRETTVIDGDYEGTVVDVQADGVLVCGFTIIECKKTNNWEYNVVQIIDCKNVVIVDNIISIGPEPWFKPWFAGVYLKDSSNNLIQDNIIFDDSGAGRTTGVTIHEGSTFNNVSGNEIYGYTDGIYLVLSGDNMIYGNDIHHNGGGIQNYGHRNKIINNIVTNNPSKGIRNDNAVNTLISGNTVTNNGDGGEFDCGIMISGANDNTIVNNHILNNNPTGIFVLGDNNEITNNIISNNKQLGIYLISDNSLITDNHISNNGNYGIGVDFSYDNTISRNNLIDNGKNAYFEIDLLGIFTTKWNNNYWSDSLGLLPFKLIPGTVYVLIFFHFPFFNIDSNPAQEPYDIEGVV